MGDFNCAVHNIDVLQVLMREQKMFDIGAIEHLAGPDCEAPTCLAHGATRAMRRDYIVANALAMSDIESYTVHHGTGLDVHEC
eukprot:2358673-Alexandrium_andersonii.AAC.1